MTKINNFFFTPSTKRSSCCCQYQHQQQSTSKRKPKNIMRSKKYVFLLPRHSQSQMKQERGEERKKWKKCFFFISFTTNISNPYLWHLTWAISLIWFTFFPPNWTGTLIVQISICFSTSALTSTININNIEHRPAAYTMKTAVFYFRNFVSFRLVSLLRSCASVHRCWWFNFSASRPS